MWIVVKFWIYELQNTVSVRYCFQDFWGGDDNLVCTKKKDDNSFNDKWSI
jgi:hypothetical protein